MDRTAMIDNLKEGICEIRFNKVNGDVRIMTCTLNGMSIPTDQIPDAEPKYQPRNLTEESAIRVFDLDKQEWRSFRPMSVTSFMNHSGKVLV